MKIKNMNRGVLSRLVAVAAIALCCVMALPTVVHAEDVPENTNEYHIKNANDFLVYVALSRERDTSGWRVYLDNDIVLNDDDMKTIVSHTVKHLSFGNKEHPFKGVFDGQNHTVEGLSYDKDAFDPERDTGFLPRPTVPPSKTSWSRTPTYGRTSAVALSWARPSKRASKTLWSWRARCT